jgi:glycopeptide antibiotics resistance protein
VPGTFVAEIQPGPVLVPLLVGVVVVWLLALGHRRALTWGRAATVLVATVYAAGVVAVTFFPWQVPFASADVLVPGGVPPLDGSGRDVSLRSLLNVVPLVTIDPQTFLLNIVMTLPLGALLPLLVRVRSIPAVALVGLLVSTGIEVGQGVGDVLLGMTRTVDVNDLIANVTGTVLGLLVFRTVCAVTGSRFSRFALPGSAVAATSGSSRAQTGPSWFVDDSDETPAYGAGPDRVGSTSSPLAGASTATTPAASSAVPKTRSPSSAYGSR